MADPKNLTLQEFLQFNIGWFEKAVQTVKAGGDLRPQLSFFDRDGNLGVMMLGLQSAYDKDVEMAMARGLLKQRGATIYALFSAAWSVRLEGIDEAEAKRLSDLIGEHGTSHPEVKHLRQELYFVSVGDKNGTLFAGFSVERDYKGKIRHLHRKYDVPASGMMTGRMMDLLAEPRH